MKLKHFIAIFIIATLLAALSFSVLAETVSDIPPEEPPQTEGSGEDVVETTLTPLQEFVKTAKENGTVYEVKFTSDSVCTEGIYTELLYDELEDKLYLALVTDLPTGYVIYDNVETEYTDGLKINDAYAVLGNKPFKIYLDNPLTSYTIFVKTTYSDTMYGTIAKIQDGNATVLDLFENPVMLMQTMYYVIAAISLVAASVLATRSKKIKVKTSEEVAAQTASVYNTSNEEFRLKLTSEILGVVNEKLLPALNTCVNTNQNVVKAIAISNSKDRNAPVALLDVLREVADTTVETAVDEAIASAEKHIEESEARKTETITALHDIAESTPADSNISIF